MKKWLTFIFKILKDERGDVEWWSWPFDTDDLFGKEETYDPLDAQDLRSKYKGYLSGKLGQQTPYRYNPAFEIPKPAIETQTENVISGRLGNLPTSEQYKEKVEKAKAQDIAREKEATETQTGEERGLYNKLGLVSSTPWLTRFGEIGDESLMRQGDISSKYDMFGLNYNLAADKLVDDIINQRVTQGQVLGQAQRGYAQYPIDMSMQDIMRMVNEEQSWAGLTGSYLGQATPQRSYQPGLIEQAMGYGADILPYLLLMA